MGRLIRRRGQTFQLRMGDEEREVVAALMLQLRELITERDSTAWRLFPNAYQDDPAMAAEYEDMVGDDLRDGRLGAIEIVEETVHAKELTPEQVHSWMGAVNDLRLVLGTRLDVTEESEMSDYNTNMAKSLFSAYLFLGYLLEELVAAISN